MQYESPSQDPRLTVDERLKLLYPMVNVINNKKMLCALINFRFTPNHCLSHQFFIILQVNEEETPLPRSWSTKDKYQYTGLSQSNLRVHYKVAISPFPVQKTSVV